MIEVRIDNMFYSKKDKRNIDLKKLYYYMQKNYVYFVNYNPELFCGMFLEPYNKKQGNELQKVGTVHHISAQETVLVRWRKI